ncbi:MAG: Hsp33 family molecular chaperone HslO, partial [Alphaproteobacteria bacterium]|nr:Hsp33 family molecular chaperone HslO [Alphaproteobacteria bacterium]
MDGQAAFRDDYVRPFRLGGTRVRGRLVRLGPEVAQILDRHAYPDAQAEVLGESLAIAAALSQSLKAEGIFTL